MRYAFLVIFSSILMAAIPARIPLNRMTDFPYTDTIPSTVNLTGFAMEYSVDLTSVSPHSDININFRTTAPTPLLSCVFLAVSSDQTKFKAYGMNVTSFYGKNYTQFQGNIDLISMQLGKRQYINRQKYLGQDMLYLTVYSLDPNYRRVNVTFVIQLTIDTSVGYNMVCFSCNSGVRKNPQSSCLCKNCAPGYYGPDCSINMLTLTGGQPSTASINGPGMAFFQITQTNEVTILVKLSVGIGEIYFTFVDFDGQFASYTNVAEGRSIQGRFLLMAGTSGTPFTAVSTGAPMSLTIAIYDDINANVEVSYTVTSKSNVLLIVLSVLGGVLFVGLVIAAIYIIRNSTWFRGERGQSSRQIRPISDNLSDEEIQRFFPTVLLKSIRLNNSFEQQQSRSNLAQNSPNQKINVQDCVICLCSIQMQEQIKVTYCRHIFHAQCLVGWFKKQQNCPYCREQFTRINTIKLYKKVKEMKENNIIRGEELVNAIIESKHAVVASKESLEAFNEKETNKIKIGSRNSIHVENMS